MRKLISALMMLTFVSLMGNAQNWVNIGKAVYYGAKGVKIILELLPKPEAYDATLFGYPNEVVPFDLNLQKGLPGLPGQWLNQAPGLTAYDHLGVARCEGFDVLCFQEQGQPGHLLSPLSPRAKNFENFRCLSKPQPGLDYSWEPLANCINNEVEYRVQANTNGPVPIRVGLAEPLDDKGSAAKKQVYIYPAIVRQYVTWVPGYWVEGGHYAMYVTPDLEVGKLGLWAWTLPDGTVSTERPANGKGFGQTIKLLCQRHVKGPQIKE